MWGPELIQKKIGGLVPNIFGNSDNVLYGYRGDPSKGLYFEKFNEIDLSLTSQYLMMTKKDFAEETSEELYDIYLKDDQIYAFFTVFPSKKEKNKEFKMMVRIYNLEFILVNEKELATAKGGMTYNPFLSIKFSPDKSKFLIVALPDSRIPNEMSIFTYTDNLELIESKDVNIDYKFNSSYLISRIDNEANVYFFFKDKQPKTKNSGKDAVRYNYELFISQKGGGNRDIIHHETKSLKDGKYLVDLTFGVSGKNEISFVGFYSNTSKLEINGIFLIKYDIGEKKPKHSTFDPFEKDFIKEFTSEKKADKGSGIPDYNLDYTIFRNDGKIVLIAEESYSYTSCKTSQGSTTCTTYYVYGDLLVAHIGSEGQLLNSAKIDKYTVTTSSFGATYMLGINKANGTVHIIYQRNRKDFEGNKDEKVTSSPLGYKKGIIAMHSSIDPEGKVATEQLFDCEKENTAMYMRYYTQINDNTMIIIGKLKAWKLGKITF
jgi:hypothetical protein